MIRLRIAEPSWLQLHDALFSRTDVESAAILLAEPLAAGGHPLLAVREVRHLRDADYLIRAFDQLRIDPVALNRAVRPARDRGWSIFTVHTHPGATAPWFSWADDRGDERLMPAMHVQSDSPVHGSVVVVPGGAAAARGFGAQGQPAEVLLRIVGRTLGGRGAFGEEEDARFARQSLALGREGQARLRGLRVGVVGLGGTGSVVAIQLAHLGVGELLLLDGDTVESPNVSRVVGVRADDVGHTKKVDVLSRYIAAAGLPGRIESMPSMLGGEAELRALRACDVVFSCVDRHMPRAMLNRLAYEALVPVIDMGTAFRVGSNGAMTGDAGRVLVVGPGRRCLACFGHLDPAALRREALPAEEREREVRDGYIEGASVPQPSVIAFNTMVAGAAVVEFLRLVTGFAGAEDPPQRLAFSFSEGTVRRNRLADERPCVICRPSMLAGT